MAEMSGYPSVRRIHRFPLLSGRRRWFVAVVAGVALVTAAAGDHAHDENGPGDGRTAAAVPQPESNRRMAALLREVDESARSFRNPYRFTETADRLREVMRSDIDPARLMKFRLPYAHALLLTGDSAGAFAEFEAYERIVRESGRGIPPAEFIRLQTAKAISHLRLGEQENCLLNHNADSCLLPIRGGGVHLRQEGSRNAVAELLPLLQRYPGDLRARWLLNIAYMTLGEYPEGVPEPWLIPPEVFESEHDIQRFPDVAGALGLAVDDLAGGVVVDDFDRDGLLDVMTSAWGLDSPLRYFRNRGDGTFSEGTAAAGLAGLNSGLNLVQGDYDNDGLVDVLVLRGAWLDGLGGHPNSLLRNNGDHTFTDVTEAAGLLSFHPTQTAVWFDFDGDGWLDLFIGNESQDQDIHPCELYRNNGDGTFTECAEAAGVGIVGFVKAVVSGDFNNDGRPDLYLSRLDGANHLLRNDGPAAAGGWRFTETAAAAGVTEPFRSFTGWFWDYDQDGWEDLFVAGYSIQDAGDVAADFLGLPHTGERARLYRNRGDGTFEDTSREAGLHRLLHTMGGNHGDLDNDGWPDLYLGTGDPDFTTLVPNRMFRNAGGDRFQDVTTSGGFGQLQKGHGIAFADLDNDGDQDIYSVVGGAVDADNYFNQVFANPGHGNRWIKLMVEGTRSNRLAVGTRVRVVVRSADGGERILHRTVGSGGSFGAAPLRLEVGLGDAAGVERVELFWPATGATQVVTGLEPGRMYRIREDEAAATPVELPSFPMPTAAESESHHHH